MPWQGSRSCLALSGSHAAPDDFSVLPDDFSVPQNDSDVTLNDCSALLSDFSLARSDSDAVLNEFSVLRNDFLPVRNDFDVPHQKIEPHLRNRQKEMGGRPQFGLSPQSASEAKPVQI